MKTKDNEPKFKSIDEALFELNITLDPKISFENKTNSAHIEKHIQLRKKNIQEAAEFVLKNFDTSQLLPN